MTCNGMSLLLKFRHLKTRGQKAELGTEIEQSLLMHMSKYYAFGLAT